MRAISIFMLFFAAVLSILYLSEEVSAFVCPPSTDPCYSVGSCKVAADGGWCPKSPILGVGCAVSGVSGICAGPSHRDASCTGSCTSEEWGVCDPTPTATVSHSPPSPTTGTTVTIDVDVTDAGATISDCRYGGKCSSFSCTTRTTAGIKNITTSVDGSVKCAKTFSTPYPASESCDPPPSTYSGGSHTVSVVAYDASNSVGGTSYSFCVNAGSVSLSASPSSESVSAGGSTAPIGVAASLTSGASSSITFYCSGLPSGASCSFSPPSCGPSCSSSLTISTASSTPPGTYSITISASGSCMSISPTSYTLIVNPPFDFSLSLDSKGSNATPASKQTTNISVALVSGTPQTVSVSYSPASSDYAVSFNASFCEPPCGIMATMDVSSSAAAGLNKITFKGIAGTTERTADYDLNITPASGEEIWRGCGKIKIGEPAKVKAPIIPITTKSGVKVRLNVEADATDCGTIDIEVFLKNRPPEGWDWVFCDTPDCTGDTGKTLKLTSLSGSKELFLLVTIPTYAAPGNYKLIVSARKV